MRPAQARLLLYIVCASTLIACGSSQNASLDDERVDGELARNLDRFLQTEADSGWAGTVLVAQNGRIILHKGYGTMDRGNGRIENVSTRTPFWIASISKQFAAAALLTLVESGTIALEDSLPRVFAGVPPDKRGIRIAQLLDHTSGLGRNYAADGIEDRRQAVEAIFATELRHPPGTEFGYSNDAYNLVAAAVETVSGMPFERYSSERLFAPAGLRSTGFWGPREHPEVAVIRTPPADTNNMRPNWGFRGGTGMFSTAGDLYRWNAALEDGRVLSKTSVMTLFEAHTRTKKGIGVGYGWFTSRTAAGTPKRWTRGHEDFGHGAVLAVYPEEDVVIIVASNAGERNGVPLSHRLSEALEERILAQAP